MLSVTGSMPSGSTAPVLVSALLDELNLRPSLVAILGQKNAHDQRRDQNTERDTKNANRGAPADFTMFNTSL